MEDKFHKRLLSKIGEGINKGIDLATSKDVESIIKFVDKQIELHPD